MEFFGPIPTDPYEHRIYTIVLRQTLGYIIEVNMDQYFSSRCDIRHRYARVASGTGNVWPCDIRHR